MCGSARYRYPPTRFAGSEPDLLKHNIVSAPIHCPVLVGRELFLRQFAQCANVPSTGERMTVVDNNGRSALAGGNNADTLMKHTTCMTRNGILRHYAHGTEPWR